MNLSLPGTRFGMIVLLVLASVAVLISFWVLEVMRRSGEEEGPQRKRIEPDYYVENFTFLRQSVQSGTRYQVSGRRLEHDPVDGSYHVQLPVVNSYYNDRPPMKSTAKLAIVSADNSQVHLYDDVQVDRAGDQRNQPMHLTSQYLLVLPNQDVVRTDKAVEIKLGTSVVKGTGMLANNLTRQVQLFNAVHATFLPAARNSR